METLENVHTPDLDMMTFPENPPVLRFWSWALLCEDAEVRTLR